MIVKIWLELFALYNTALVIRGSRQPNLYNVAYIFPRGLGGGHGHV